MIEGERNEPAGVDSWWPTLLQGSYLEVNPRGSRGDRFGCHCCCCCCCCCCVDWVDAPAVGTWKVGRERGESGGDGGGRRTGGVSAAIAVVVRLNAGTLGRG